MSDWHVMCVSCQEPVGKPFWPGGCACEDEQTPYQAILLATLNSIHDAAATATATPHVVEEEG